MGRIVFQHPPHDGKTRFPPHRQGETMLTGAPIEAPVPKNGYASNPRIADWTIAQDWPSYTSEEHDRWNRLFARQAALLPGRACEEALAAMARLELSRSGIPDFADLSKRLAAITGWRVAPVAIDDAEAHCAGARPMAFCKFGGEAVRLGIDDIVNAALPVQGDVFRTMPCDSRKAHQFEKGGKLRWLRMGELDKLKAVGPHRIVIR
jgi:Biopterin-dependent aromatic amino acid hydroxylase